MVCKSILVDVLDEFSSEGTDLPACFELLLEEDVLSEFSDFFVSSTKVLLEKVSPSYITFI